MNQTNQSLYVKQTNEYLLITILYVDNLIMLASNVIQLKRLEAELEKKFRMRDFLELYYCLGMGFWKNRGARAITLNQKNITLSWSSSISTWNKATQLKLC